MRRSDQLVAVLAAVTAGLLAPAAAQAGAGRRSLVGAGRGLPRGPWRSYPVVVPWRPGVRRVRTLRSACSTTTATVRRRSTG